MPYCAVMKIKDLKPNVKNPRRITPKKLEMLKKSLHEFGDLSGFVYNRRTKTLISGHQRQKALPMDVSIKIEKKYDQPSRTGTVAEGYVEHGGERFKYREVDVDKDWETAALIAANKHQGEWDRDLLKLALSDLKMDLDLTGFELEEIGALGIAPVAPVAREAEQKSV
jgi:hypothetical protein